MHSPCTIHALAMEYLYCKYALRAKDKIQTLGLREVKVGETGCVEVLLGQQTKSNTL
jgi:hypothetical protein